MRKSEICCTLFPGGGWLKRGANSINGIQKITCVKLVEASLYIEVLEASHIGATLTDFQGPGDNLPAIMCAHSPSERPARAQWGPPLSPSLSALVIIPLYCVCLH